MDTHQSIEIMTVLECIVRAVPAPFIMLQGGGGKKLETTPFTRRYRSLRFLMALLQPLPVLFNYCILIIFMNKMLNEIALNILRRHKITRF